MRPRSGPGAASALQIGPSRLPPEQAALEYRRTRRFHRGQRASVDDPPFLRAGRRQPAPSSPWPAPQQLIAGLPAALGGTIEAAALYGSSLTPQWNSAVAAARLGSRRRAR